MKYAEWVVSGCAAAVAEYMSISVDEVIAAADSDKIVRRGRALGWQPPLGNHMPDKLTRTERMLLRNRKPFDERLLTDRDVEHVLGNNDYWATYETYSDDPDFEPKSTVRWTNQHGVTVSTTLGGL
ncbi:MAG: hypothetical protein PHQ43_08170 [Dehalococcoidales bacterium]|jgi:hypothetical protein|nr:hypothetical protein [Dehalococcoidales bacterium]